MLNKKLRKLNNWTVDPKHSLSSDETQFSVFTGEFFGIFQEKE